MTSSDLFVAAIEEARSHTPPGYPTGGVDAFLRCAPGWPDVRLAQECATLAAEISGAHQTGLYSFDGETFSCVALFPPHLESPLALPSEVSAFPWGMGILSASRFLLVEDASSLPAGAGSPAGPSLGELGLRSAVHLPLWAGNRAIGAMHLYWTKKVSEWDDQPGALLRAVGVYTFDRISRSRDRRSTDATV